MLTVLVPVAIVALIVIIGVIAFQRGRDGIDFSPQAMLRAYLYVGSFAGVIALAFGVSALLNGALASVVGNQIVYGGVPVPAIARPCPVGATCPPEPDLEQITERQRQESDRRRQEDLLRGATFTIFGALFYGAHRAARRSLYPRNLSVGAHDGLERAYHLLGTVVFGIGAIALLPAGLYQLLANSLLTIPGDFFRQGVSDTLTGGVVSTVLWLLYLRAVLRDTGGGSGGNWVHRRGPASPPAEGAPVGARIGPGPGERSAGAEATPPEFRSARGWRPRGTERLREIERRRERGEST